MQFQMSIIRDIIYGAASHGAPFHVFCRRLGIDPQELSDSEKMVDWEQAADMWRIAIELTGDELIGLHMGGETRATSLGMVGYLMQSCRTLMEASDAVTRYNNTYSSTFRYLITYEKNKVYRCFEPNPLYLSKFPVSARQAVEFSMSSALGIMYKLTGKKIYPVKAELAFPKRQVTEYQKVLQTEVIFGAPRNCLTFNRADYDTPIVSYDQSLFALFNSLLVEKQSKLATSQPFSREVRGVLLSHFKGIIPAIDVIAAHLNVTRRTFQRRLSAEGKSYRSVCQELKKELALALLEQNNKKISDVALLLGYADHASFRRAFKSWTNQWPKELQAE
jgi:AraC-like DNA-binding protein